MDRALAIDTRPYWLTLFHYYNRGTGNSRNHCSFERSFKFRLIMDKVGERTIVRVSHPNEDRKFDFRPSLVGEINIDRIRTRQISPQQGKAFTHCCWVIQNATAALLQASIQPRRCDEFTERSADLDP